MAPGVTAEPSKAPHPAGNSYLEVQNIVGKAPKTRKVVMMTHFSPQLCYKVHDSNITNLTRGIKERVFFVKDSEGNFVSPPKPDPGFLERTLCLFRSHLQGLLPKTTPISHDEFVETYTGRRKTVMRKAADSLITKPFHPRDAKTKCFIKAEKILFDGKKEPVPRIIQPRDPRYNVKLGIYLKTLEKKIFRAINKLFGPIPTIMKGYNAEDSGRLMRKKWDRFKDPIAVGLDASRFDQHVSKEALEFEHSIYLLCFPYQWLKKKLKYLLDFQLFNTGFGFVNDGFVRYGVEGCRLSGDMNTSLGNCLLMCAMIWSYCRSVGLRKYELANNGDDCVVIMERWEYDRFRTNLESYFTKLGFTMKVEEPVRIFEQIDFCQTSPVFDGEKWIMVRNIFKGLAKDCVSLIYNDTVESLTKYYRVLGEAGLHLTGGIPIYQEFYTSMVRFTPEYNPKELHSLLEGGLFHMVKGIYRKYSPVTPIARYSFWRAFGITPDEQICMENLYRKLEFSFRELRERVPTYILNFPGVPM